MIRLYQYPRAWGLPNPSPFCVKLETYLKMTGLEYEAVHFPDPRKAPKGKLPFIDDDGTTVADSAMVIDHLKRKYGDPLDARLTPGERALGHVVRRMLEEGFYFPFVYSRWIDEAGWKVASPLVRDALPMIARSIVPGIIRKTYRETLQAQGTTHHSRGEIYDIGKADLTALSVILGDRTHLLGDAPTSFDATVFGFLSQVVYPPIENPLHDHAVALPNLRAYADRMRARYFPA